MKDRIEKMMRQTLAEQVSKSSNPKAKKLSSFIQESASYDQVKQMYYESQDRKAAYDAFFRGKLKAFGVSSPDELKGEVKKKFFDEVDAEWKAKKETD